jgi:glutathione S-transferase
MTVPTLIGPGLVLKDSRDIVLFAFGFDDLSVDEQTRYWLDLHYEYPVDELTFGRAMQRSTLAQFIVPLRLKLLRRKLFHFAKLRPELAAAYLACSVKLDGRIQALAPETLNASAKRRTAEALGLLDRLNLQLSHGLPHLCGDSFGPADVVWAVFLARINLLGLAGELNQRHHIARYWAAVRSRRSFIESNIWCDFSPQQILGAIASIVRPQP